MNRKKAERLVALRKRLEQYREGMVAQAAREVTRVDEEKEVLVAAQKAVHAGLFDGGTASDLRWISALLERSREAESEIDTRRNERCDDLRAAEGELFDARRAMRQADRAAERLREADRQRRTKAERVQNDEAGNVITRRRRAAAAKGGAR